MAAEPHNLGYWITLLAGSTGFWGFPIVWPSLAYSPPREAWDHRLEFLRLAKTYLNQAQLRVYTGPTKKVLSLGTQWLWLCDGGD